MPVRTILVPTDFSPTAAAALQLAIDVARPFDASIHLLHSSFVDVAMTPPFPNALLNDLLETVASRARTQLQALEEQVVRAGLAAQSHVSRTDPTQAILELARSLPADLIVIGTHGHRGLKHVVLGSIAERTVRLAPCPVLTTKGPVGAD